MRTRHATVLSIAGVLAAGFVAALVNVQALAGSGGRATTSLASTQLDASSSVSTAGTSATTATDRSAATPPPSVVNSPPLLFALGASGTLTLDDVNGVLDVVAIAPAGGWSVSAMSSVDATTAVVDFASAGSSVRATAVLRDSVITVEVIETPTIVRPPTPVAPTAAPRDDDSGGHGSDDLVGSDGDSPDD